MSARIALQDGTGKVLAWAMVDDDLADWLSDWSWYLNPRGYAARSTTQTSYMMHRQILGLLPGDPLQGDHVNGDPLDNRRENLRAVSAYVNQLNKKRAAGAARAVGVSFDPRKRMRPWRARFGKECLGWYATVEEAAEVARIAREKTIEELIAA